MVKRLEKTTCAIGGGIDYNTASFTGAVAIYICFAAYLYQPYFKNFSRWQYLLIFNAFFGSLGCYILSRRWMSGFAGSFFAGAIYGFGPFSLWLVKFHPTAGLLAAAIPWLFCPAVFGPKKTWRFLAVLLSTLPFLIVVMFFRVAALYGLYPVPIQLKLHLSDLASILVPLVAVGRGMTLIGFYHVPIAALVMGFSMLLAARRIGVIIIFIVGIILASCGSFLDVSPIIWLAVPLLCCSILIGAGIQGLACAGFADRKWILADVMVMGMLTIATLLLAIRYSQSFLTLKLGYAGLFVRAAEMYLLGTIALAILFFLACAKLRWRRLWAGFFYVAMSLDIFLGARFIIDKIL
jgi:hypothetical protein